LMNEGREYLTVMENGTLAEVQALVREHGFQRHDWLSFACAYHRDDVLEWLLSILVCKIPTHHDHMIATCLRPIMPNGKNCVYAFHRRGMLRTLFEEPQYAPLEYAIPRSFALACAFVDCGASKPLRFDWRSPDIYAYYDARQHRRACLRALGAVLLARCPLRDVRMRLMKRAK